MPRPRSSLRGARYATSPRSSEGHITHTTSPGISGTFSPSESPRSTTRDPSAAPRVASPLFSQTLGRPALNELYSRRRTAVSAHLRSSHAVPCDDATQPRENTLWPGSADRHLMLSREKWTKANRDIQRRAIRGASTKATMDMSLMRIFMEGPEVSLNGSPTVSPTTAAL